MFASKVLFFLFCSFDSNGAFRGDLSVRKNVFALRGGAISFTGSQQEGQTGPGNTVLGANYPREIISELKGLSLSSVNESVELAPALEQGETRWDDSFSGLPLNASDERNLLRLQLRVAQVTQSKLQPWNDGKVLVWTARRLHRC